MKITGIFYLTNGCVHKEVLKVPKGEEEKAIALVEKITHCTTEVMEESRIHFGFFHVPYSNVIAVKFK